MSNSVRDPQEELEHGAAGEIGLPVDARCTGCKKVRAKRANKIMGDPDDGSFRHICHTCKKVKWWNVIRILDVDPEGDS